MVRRFEATLVWMNARPLDAHRPFLLKHTAQTVQARIREIRYRTDIHTLEQVPANQLHLNEIGFVAVEAQKPLFCDPYTRNRQTGSFILIDPITNDTLAAGMISGPEAQPAAGPVSAEERTARVGHAAHLFLLTKASAATAAQVERALFDQGYLVYLTESLEGGEIAADAGMIALVYGPEAVPAPSTAPHTEIAAATLAEILAAQASALSL